MTYPAAIPPPNRKQTEMNDRKPSMLTPEIPCPLQHSQQQNIIRFSLVLDKLLTVAWLQYCRT